MTTFILWLLVGLQASLMLYFWWWKPKSLEQRQTLRGIVFLRRTHGLDTLLVMIVVGAALVYTQQTKQAFAQQSALFGLLLLLFVYGMHYPRWLIYQEGFYVVGRFYRFSQLEAIQLSEDGILQLSLQNRAPLLLPILNMGELEKALWILSDGAAGHLMPNSASQ